VSKYGQCGIVANTPNNAIYDFKGQFVEKMQDGQERKEGLGLENTAWANTVMASSGYILGIVL
jgi:hypothetical protein